MPCFFCTNSQFLGRQGLPQSCFKRDICNKGGKKKRKIVPVPEITRFVIDVLRKLGVQEDKAKIFADGLIIADYKGIFSHGINRLEHYIKDIRDKNCDPNAQPEIVRESESAALVAGKNGFGTVVGMFCMNLAIKKAKKTGIAMVSANGSNHFGLNSFYTNHAVKNGFIGMAFTNTSPVLVPFGAKKACLGTNPISIAAPGMCNDSLMIDFATTTVAMGKIEVYRKKKQKIPLGWGLDVNGKPTDDPEAVIKSKKLTPLGGNEGHKGTGMALLVEVLSGILSGSAFGPNVRFWGQKPIRPANLGHGFIAINPKKFAPDFEKRLSELMNHIRKLEPVDSKRPMVVPGDMERATMKRIDDQGGIEYAENLLQTIEKITKDLGVKPVQFKK